MAEVEGSIPGGRAGLLQERWEGQPGPSFSAPLGGERQARLEFVRGAFRLVIHGDQSLRNLCLARFTGMIPQVVTVQGAVRLSYGPASALQDSDATSADVTLNGGLPWSLVIDGGVSELSADLRRLQLTSLEIRGGAGRCELVFSKPWGTVRVRVEGGVGHLRALRPARVEARLQIKGGLGKVSFDGHDLDVSGSRARFESSGFREAADRFDIEVRGGARDATVDTF